MAFFQWQDSFSTSIDLVDRQHKKLIGLVNRLHEAVARSNDLATVASVMREMNTVTSVIDELTDYALYHFNTEEQYMLQYDYGEYDRHHHEHRLFIDRANDYKHSFENNKTRLSIDIVNFLVKWWKNHILESDKKLGAYLHQRGMN